MYGYQVASASDLHFIFISACTEVVDCKKRALTSQINCTDSLASIVKNENLMHQNQ